MMPPAHKKRKLSPPAIDNSNPRLLQSVPSRPLPRDKSDVAEHSINTHVHETVRNNKDDKLKVLSTGAYSSNMFQLQLEELLLKVRPAKGRMVKAEDALRKLKDIIEHIPNREPKPVRHCFSSLIVRTLTS